MGLYLIKIRSLIGRTVLLLKPPQSPHCYLGAVDHLKNSPPPLVTLQARSYRAYRATKTLLFSRPLILLRCVTEIKFAQNLHWLGNLTLELSFPVHCISNCKLNGISRTNISKVTLNADNELPTLQSGSVVRSGSPAGLGGGVKMCSGAWNCGP